MHTNARKFQLGAAIIQDENPTNLYIRKLTDPQIRCKQTEREMLSIAKKLKS